MRPLLPLVIGPTGSGKSALAFQWALRRGGEIVSVDSQQVYAGLDIGTAKPSSQERSQVTHHLLDVLLPTEQWSAAQYVSRVHAVVAEALSQGTPLVLAGGSTLHLSALVYGLSPIPDVPDEVRTQLEFEIASQGIETLVQELFRCDPALAARIDVANPRRVVRALEVYRHTGQSIADFQQRKVLPNCRYKVTYLRPPRAWLYARLDARVDRMLEIGLVEEVQSLLDRGIPPEAPGLRSIGYREVVGALTGKHSLDNAITLIKRNTRRYAKRQYTYFDKYFADVTAVDPAHTLLEDEAIDQMILPE